MIYNLSLRLAVKMTSRFSKVDIGQPAPRGFSGVWRIKMQTDLGNRWTMTNKKSFQTGSCQYGTVSSSPDVVVIDPFGKRRVPDSTLAGGYHGSLPYMEAWRRYAAAHPKGWEKDTDVFFPTATLSVWGEPSPEQIKTLKHYGWTPENVEKRSR